MAREDLSIAFRPGALNGKTELCTPRSKAPCSFLPRSCVSCANSLLCPAFPERCTKPPYFLLLAARSSKLGLGYVGIVTVDRSTPLKISAMEMILQRSSNVKGAALVRVCQTRSEKRFGVFFKRFSFCLTVLLFAASFFILQREGGGRQPCCLIACLYCSLVANTCSSALQVECSSAALRYLPVAENQANIIKIQGIPFPMALYMEKYP